VIYHKVYLIRLIDVSGILSNYMCMIYHSASRWWYNELSLHEIIEGIYNALMEIPPHQIQ